MIFKHVLYIVFSFFKLASSYAQIGKSLTSYPNDIPPDETSIALNNNQIHSVPNDIFLDFTRLSSFNMNKNKLLEVPNLSSTKTTLKILSLTENL